MGSVVKSCEISPVISGVDGVVVTVVVVTAVMPKVVGIVVVNLS